MGAVSAPTPYDEPARIVAGDTAAWLKSLGDYPAGEGWVLTYTMVNSAQRYTFAATALGDDYQVSVAATTTAGWVAGAYLWRAQVSLVDDVFTVGEGRITVAAAFTTAADSRSQARRMLEAVDAALEGRASSSVAEYTIGGRSMKNMAVPELMQLRDRLRFDVKREDDADRAAAGLPPTGRIAVRFGAW